MHKHIYVKEAIHNAAWSLREDEDRWHISDAAQANKNREIAIRRGHEKAAAFWAEVMKFCKARDRAGRGLVLHIEQYSLG